MARLGLILSPPELSVAELSAATLDGDLFPVDEHYAPVDIPAGPAHRALALSRLSPARLIAERLSAAWVHGALRSPPRRHEFCVEASRRVHLAPSMRLTVREVIIADDEVMPIAGMPVTTPLRTVIDIARISADFGEREAAVVRSLIARFKITVDACDENLEATPHLPFKRRAGQRLRGLINRP